MWNKSRTLGVVVGGLLFLAALWFLFVGKVANYDTSKKNMRIRVPPTDMFNHLKLNDKERHILHLDPKAFFVSKRRVPNGPDPIHNRFRHISLHF